MATECSEEKNKEKPMHEDTCPLRENTAHSASLLNVNIDHCLASQCVLLLMASVYRTVGNMY